MMHVPTLKPNEFDILANHKRSLQDADALFTRETLDSKDNNGDIETAFEKAMRVKVTLDALENGSVIETNERVLAFIITGEFWLWRASMASLRVHPFLSHWVEAVQRLDTKDKQEHDALENLSLAQIIAFRVLWMKTLLQGKDLQRWFQYTPAEVYDQVMKKRHRVVKLFNIQLYIRDLVDSGVYDNPADVEAVASSLTQGPVNGHNGSGKKDSETTEQSPQDALQKEKAAILSRLEQQPNDAIFDIIRLPIAIPYLDFLTKLLADRTLEKHNIDPSPIVTQYIQHALRIVEAAERPPSPSLETETNGNGHRPETEYGKDAQQRYIRLLLLFIKNLIRKGLVESNVLYYEIAEITVRYAVMKEVRDFRQWAEDGIEEDDRAG